MLQLIGRGAPLQSDVSVRESPEASDDLPMPQGHGVRAWIGPLFEQLQGLCLHVEVLAVKPWHQPELTPGKLFFLLNPAALFGKKADFEGLAVSGKGG